MKNLSTYLKSNLYHLSLVGAVEEPSPQELLAKAHQAESEKPQCTQAHRQLWVRAWPRQPAGFQLRLPNHTDSWQWSKLKKRKWLSYLSPAPAYCVRSWCPDCSHFYVGSSWHALRALVQEEQSATGWSRVYPHTQDYTKEQQCPCRRPVHQEHSGQQGMNR